MNTPDFVLTNVWSKTLITVEELCTGIGEGWHPLLRDIVAQLFAIGWDGQIVQVKEKFGGLRVYIEGNDEQQKLVAKMAHHSYDICEDCGEPGTLRQGGWMRTLCDEHEVTREAMDRCSSNIT